MARNLRVRFNASYFWIEQTWTGLVWVSKNVQLCSEYIENRASMILFILGPSA